MEEKKQNKIECSKHGVQLLDKDGLCPKCDRVKVKPLKERFCDTGIPTGLEYL